MSDEPQQDPEFPREHYRDLQQSIANGFKVNEHDVELWRREEELIRALCFSPRQLAECGITYRHFSAPVHALAWRAVISILEAIPDLRIIEGAVLLAYIRRLDPGVLAGRRGQSWIDALYSEQPIPFDIAMHTVVRELEQHWRIVAWSARMHRIGDRVGKDTNWGEVQGDFARAGLDISNQALSEEPIDDPIDEEPWNPNDRELGHIIRTGIPQLDAALGGGHATGDMLSIGGGTNHGKSYFGIDLGIRHAEAGGSCLIYSAEDPKELYQCRVMSRYTLPLCSPESIRMRRADAEVVEKAKDVMRKALGGRLHIRVKRKPTIDDVCRDIRTYAHMRGVKMAIVDYGQAVRDPEFPGNRVQEMSSVLTKLKRTCSEVEVALVLLSQYARDDYKEGQEPGINSFKYCGDIENESESVVCLWRDKNGVLHVKIPKSKWTRGRKLRYVINVCETTGNFKDWEDDFSDAD